MIYLKQECLTPTISVSPGESELTGGLMGERFFGKAGTKLRPAYFLHVIYLNMAGSEEKLKALRV